MPNWCWNRLRISGSTAERLKKFREKAVGTRPKYHEPEASHEHYKPDETVLEFHNIVPVPDEVLAAGFNDAGYDWEIQNWGCKWGACRAEIVDHSDSELVYEFETPWGPPTEFLNRASNSWPDLKFVCIYDEPGMCFRGRYETENGKTLLDTCEQYEYEEVEDDVSDEEEV